MALVKSDAKHINAKRNIIDYKAKQALIARFEAANCTVQVLNSKNHHMKITGEARVVEFYPTTGTVNAGKTKTSKPVTLRYANFEYAISRVIDLAVHGY